MQKLVDQEARNFIKNALDENILVEAAAGTGKTTELINRMVSVIANGRAEIREIVGVTFTDKAAGELKLRLRARLALEARDTPDPAVRRRLQEASAHLEEAQVNTIHGFCADLLRERPVEAGIDPAFEILGDESQAKRVYRQTFDLWLQEQLEAPPEGIRRALRRHSREDPVERLRAAGWELAGWRDFNARWRRDPWGREAEIDSLVASLARFTELTEHPASKADPFYQTTRQARRLKEDLDRLEKVRERDYDGLEAELVGLARDRDEELRQFRDPKKGYGAEYRQGVTRVAVQQAHAELLAALEQFADRADADLAALLQSELAESLDRYEQLKRRSGKLDFIDLQLRARDLLRSSVRVRSDFQRRFRRIFIDEFQDTDPLQVEILMLLAAGDPSIGDWRQAKPAPGKLFVVGDPKQAIYRFRRAELEIYHQVKKLLDESHARCLTLTTSFRAVPSIQRAVNAAFAPAMNGDAANLQADYVPLSPHREELGGRPTVVALPVPRPYGKTGGLAASAVERSLPDATAAWVEWLLNESGWQVTETTKEEPQPVKARHVCLLFRRMESYGEDKARPYVEALEARDIPHLLVGGKSFHEREEVATMRVALSAVEWPDDELSVFATLKGSLFAITDAALLEYRHHYRRLHPFFIPDALPAGELAPIVDALRVLRELHRMRNRRPAAEIVTRLLESSRAAAGFALRPSGEQALANVLHLAEVARQYEDSGGISFRGLVERLREEAESGEAPEAPILEEGSDGVRIMTLHKAKGLEFPVVILADITAKLARSYASRYLDSSRALCAMPIAGCTPVDLREHDAEEALRDRAEGVRVAYVAATRARDLLVVPAVGDDPEELRWPRARDWWVSPLHRAIYPAAEKRRRPAAAVGCPRFGLDSVRRPSGRAGPENVCPGAHEFQSPPIAGGKKPLPYAVAWWDPAALRLDVGRKLGLRQEELLRPGSAETVERDLKAYKEWRARRVATIEQGSQPTRTVRTATEQARERAGSADEAVVDCALVEVAREIERPAGPRYGALVHAVLSTIALDAKGDAVRAAAALEGRILGATPAEADSAASVVEAVLQHPLMARARVAMTTGECRRETPVTLAPRNGAVTEGVVDVAFREGDEWIVVDFKTDLDIQKRLTEYRRQVSVYARAIETATGRRTSAVLMWV